jgi:hypothetical protein
MEEGTRFAERLKWQLWDRMARESEAMAEHALSSGRTIPFEVVERLDQALSAFHSTVAVAVSFRDRTAEVPRAEAIVTSAPTAETSPLAALSVAHSALASIVAPATPGSILLTAEERATHPLWYAFGPLPIVRQTLCLAIISLVVLLGVSLSSQVNVESMSKTFLEMSGYPLFIVEIFLLSASSLGSCFQNVQKINNAISEGTYDPRFQSNYWARWVMGIISGIILSQLVYDLIFEISRKPSTLAIPPTVGEPILALLGGYSVDLVVGILNRVIGVISSLFQTPGDTAIEAHARTPAAEVMAQERLTRASVLAGPQTGLGHSPEINEAGRRPPKT